MTYSIPGEWGGEREGGETLTIDNQLQLSMGLFW